MIHIAETCNSVICEMTDLFVSDSSLVFHPVYLASYFLCFLSIPMDILLAAVPFFYISVFSCSLDSIHVHSFLCLSTLFSYLLICPLPLPLLFDSYNISVPLFHSYAFQSSSSLSEISKGSTEKRSFLPQFLCLGLP